MFGLSFSGQLIQGSAERTWNCISQIANLVWYKFNHFREPIMPRQRRKHHSRSRSRSHSHDKDRDAKRRKIDLYDSPNHKRSVSPPNDPTEEEKSQKFSKPGKECNKTATCDKVKASDCTSVVVIESDTEDSPSIKSPIKEQEDEDFEMESLEIKKDSSPTQNSEESKVSKEDTGCSKDEEPSSSDAAVISDSENDQTTKGNTDMKPPEVNCTPTSKRNNARSKVNCDSSDSTSDSRDEKSVNANTPVSNSVQKLSQETTPTRRLTPKQLEKKLESEKKRQQREKEREEREKQKQLEKEEREKQKQLEREQKEAEKQKRKEQKQKEIELKQKEKEEKLKEKEEKEEQKRQEKELKLKQKEEEKMRKQQEIEEKNKEKQKEEEKKQKAAAAFVNFFVPKKVNSVEEKKTEETSLFMPFEVKCDMKLPPQRREALTDEEKVHLIKLLKNNDTTYSYLKDLKTHKVRSCPKTWINRYSDEDDDVLVVEEESFLGETICEEKPKTEKMRVKFLQFHENQRPAYYGTWRKKSKSVTGRKPCGRENIFDYEVDSDDDWEEEEQGENLEVMSEEEKENEPENEDYEVDNEFFVPHGHLSDDEVDDEENSKLSPESQKQKLKLLKDAFDQDIKSKTQKIKPRSIGCIWYSKDGNNVDEAIDRYLRPLNIITKGRIEIKKRYAGGNNENAQKKKKPPRPLPENLMCVLAKLVHGYTKKREKLVIEFMDYIQANNVGIELSKNDVSKHLSQMAKWHNKSRCWIINEDIADKFKIDIVLPDVQEITEIE